MKNKRPKVLTWHIHGSYLYYLAQAKADFYLPKKPGAAGYGGRAGSFAWGDNVFEVTAGQVKNMDFDCVIFQSARNYQRDQYDILTERQRQLPRIYLEHDPPREHPTDTKHIVDDPDILLVHVTHFNNLMWDSNRTPAKVIEHGVTVPENVRYSGEIPRGIVVINNIQTRGRRLGWDIFEHARREIPLDLIGMGTKDIGGIGEVPHNELPAFIASYRFFFNPIRYTSLGLSVCEAMMTGLPIVGLATTEMATTIKNGYNGFAGTDPDKLIEYMKRLLADESLASSLSLGAAEYARERFNIDRFCQDWEETLQAILL